MTRNVRPNAWNRFLGSRRLFGKRIFVPKNRYQACPYRQRGLRDKS